MIIKRQIVVVVWEDAWKSATTDVSLKTAGDWHKPVPTQTIGWLVKQDEDGTQIANERSVDDEGNDSYRGVTFIPAKMIVSVTPFTLTSLRKRHVRQTHQLPDPSAVTLGSGSVGGGADL